MKHSRVWGRGSEGSVAGSIPWLLLAMWSQGVWGSTCIRLGEAEIVDVLWTARFENVLTSVNLPINTNKLTETHRINYSGSKRSNLLLKRVTQAQAKAQPLAKGLWSLLRRGTRMIAVLLAAELASTSAAMANPQLRTIAIYLNYSSS